MGRCALQSMGKHHRTLICGIPKKAKTRPFDRVILVPKVGVEPTLPEENYALNVARLPIPPLRRFQLGGVALLRVATIGSNYSTFGS